MTESDSTPYDEYFDEARSALTQDIAYSILLARAAHAHMKRQEGYAAKRAEIAAAKEAPTKPNV
jgi:hypothetical protein